MGLKNFWRNLTTDMRSKSYDGDGYPSNLPGNYNPAPVPVNPAEYRGHPLFEMNDGQYWYYKWENYNSAVDAYQRCPPIGAIINRKAQSFTNGITYVMNSQGKEATSADAKKMLKLLKHPNPLQSAKDFEAQGYIYQQLFGFNIILPIKPVGFKDNIDATSLWNIPACWIDINTTAEIFKRTGGIGLKEIAFQFNGARTIIPVADLIIIRDFAPSFTTLTFPGSKIAPLALPINNIIGAYESRNVLINYRGALGVLTQDSGSGQYMPLAMDNTEKEALQDDFKRYGLRHKQWKVIITSASLKWQQMGYSTKDLMLMEEVQESTKDICRNLNFPVFMLSLADTTFSNMEAAEKSLYQNCIIPDACSYYDQLSTAFGLEERSLSLEKNYTNIAALQDDREAMGRARYALDQALAIEWEKGLITRNQWRSLVGEDTKPGDDIYIGDMKQTDQPLAVQIGVGGVQALIEVLTAQGLTDEARQAALEIIFGLKPNDAARMAVSNNDGQSEEAQPGAEGAPGSQQGAQN